jgi:NADH:ubiquinone oxidoreductase subunit E
MECFLLGRLRIDRDFSNELLMKRQGMIMALDEKCLECQEATEEELLARLDEVLAEYANVPGSLIPVLQIAQALFGYLPESALRKISLALGKPYSEVAGVVGFYSFFTTVPRGKHLVRVCLGTACYVRGGKQVLAALRDLLRIEVGETTPDRQFSLDVGRCFGACGLAPVIMIDDDVHQRVKPTRLGRIIDEYRQAGAEKPTNGSPANSSTGEDS